MSRSGWLTCLTLIVSVVVALAGCQTANEHRTATGATAGAVIGAAAGAMIDSDNPTRGALIGAAAGGAVGAGVGHILQRQKEKFDRIEDLESEQQTVILEQTPPPAGSNEPEPEPIKVEKPALMVRVQSEVLFAVGSSTLSDPGRAKLEEVAAILREYPESDVYVRGYTSSEGSDQSNYELSLRRAQVVKNELVANSIDASRLNAHGMGSSDPIADNDTEFGRIQNRRVEIYIVPREEQLNP